MKKMKLFLINAVILTATSLLLRTVGVSFNVYISNKIGASGMGLFQLIMSVHNLALTLALSGIGLAATRVVAQELAKDSPGGAKRAMSKCLLHSLLFGCLSMVLLLCSASVIAEQWLQDPRTLKSLYILAVSLPFTSMCAALGGYFTAVRRVVKSALTQIFEEFVKITLTVFGLMLLLPAGLEYACLAVVAGGCLANVFSFLCSLLLYLWDRRVHLKGKTETPYPMKKVMAISLPVALSSYLRSGLTTLEHLMIPTGLRKSGATTEAALAQYGVIQGMALPIVFFPAAFIYAFANLLIPEITERFARGEMARIKSALSRVFQVVLIFSIGVGGILFFFAGDLGKTIYGNPLVGPFLQILAPLVPVMYLDTAVDSFLKGMNEQVACMRYNIIDAFVSVVLVYFLLPMWGIKGYVVVIFASEMLNTLLSAWRLITITQFRIQVLGWILKPVLAIAGGGSCGKLALLGFTAAGIAPALGLTLSIIAGVLVYFAALRILHCISKKDAVMLRSLLWRKTARAGS